MRYYDEVRLAGLLHDIGKFYQKAPRNSEIDGVKVSGSHSIISAAFVERYRTKLSELNLDVDAVKEMVQRHHEGFKMSDDVVVSKAKPCYKHLCTLISIADNISSSERLEEAEHKQNYMVAPLVSIFSSKVEGEGEGKYGQPIGRFEKSCAEISTTHTQNDTKQTQGHILSFAHRFSELDTKGGFERFFSSLNKLLLEYTWCIPSDSQQEIPDVSLYDHLKTTSALASILYLDLISDASASKGMKEADKLQGQEFTDAAVKRSNNVAILKVGLYNTQEFILNTSDICSRRADSVSDAIRNRDLANHYMADIKGYIKGSEDIGDVNILIDTGYTQYYLVKQSRIGFINIGLKSLSSRIAYDTSFRTYIEAAWVQFDTSDKESIFNSIKAVDTAYENRYSNNYFGLQSLLIKDSKWQSSKNILSVRDTGTSTVPKIAKDLENGTYAIIKVKINNLENYLTELFDKNKYSESLDYGSISRVSTATRNISQLLDILIDSVKNGISMYKGMDEVILILPLQEAFSTILNWRQKFRGATIGTLSLSMSFVTFRLRDGIENAYNRLVRDYYLIQKSPVDKRDYITYNGVKLLWSELREVDSSIQLVLKSFALNSSIIYRLREYCGMYRKFVDTGNSKYAMCIPRFNYDKARNFDDKSIILSLNKYVTDQFKLAINGSKTSRIFYAFDEIINDAISLSIRD